MNENKEAFYLSRILPHKAGPYSMPKSYLLIATTLLLLLGLLLWWHPDNADSVHYISSSECQQCHQSHHAGWQDSLHPKMFQPVSNQEIQADFSQDDPALTFTKQDIEYVLGNKWEQVYARIIDGEYYPLPAKWLIVEQRWEPYRVDTWQDTPMSKKCNGCHVTGFKVDTYEFKEFGIGCEACHGPGSAHVNNRRIGSSQLCSICHQKPRSTDGDIVNTVSGAICGQCHNRGSNVSNSDREQASFNFPVNMSPGENLSSSFVPITQKSDKKNKYWWGNGVAKKRHQEFAEWEKSKHALSLKRLREKYSPQKGPITEECLSCHAADYILNYGSQKPDVNSARYGITCVVCHNPHGQYNRSSVQQQSSSCLVCHKIDHPSCPSPTLQPHFPCPEDKVLCEDCHMPYTVKNAGAFSIRSHGFKIIVPSETGKYGVPNSCQNGSCHQDKDLDWAEQQFNMFYPGYQAGEN